MKAILIDPWKRSLETIDLLPGTSKPAIEQLYELVGERGLDEALAREAHSLPTERLPNALADVIDKAHLLGGGVLIAPGEVILVGDHSALADPRLPAYRIDGCKWPLHGRGVLVGFNRDGKERNTGLTVDELSKMIEFE
jgi:hypothetical protein